MNSTKSTVWVTVGTTKKSRAIKSLTWFCRKVYHVGDGGLGGRRRYFSTIDLVTSMPTFRSSPTIRGEPHVGLACHIAWMSSRTLGQRRGGQVFPAHSRAANGQESAAAARRSPSGAGRIPGHRASPAKAGTATPRTPDQSNGGAGERGSVCRPPIDAAAPGVRGTEMPGIGRGSQ